MPARSPSRGKRSRERATTPPPTAGTATTKRAAAPKGTAAQHSGTWYWVALFLIVFAAYAPTLTADFVNWDDSINVYENPRVTEPSGVVNSWVRTENPEFLPLTYTTFWLEWQLTGGEPWLFHLDNVLLHAGSAVLVGLFARTLGLPLIASWLVAALWALHPAQIPSVAWVTERKNVLYVFLWLASLLLYVRATDGTHAKSRATTLVYAGSLALFILAILSKRAAITLPVAIALLEWTRGRLDRRTWPTLAAYAGLALAGGLMLLQRLPQELAGPPLPLRILVACRALWFYVASFFWPVGLLPVYPRWSPTDVTAVDLAALGGVLVAAATLIALWRRLPRTVLLGVALFILNAALVVGIVWFTFLRFSLVSDHLGYLPLLGLALATVSGLWAFAPVVGLSERHVAIAVAVWCAALGVATWRSVGVWHDSETLWTTTLARNPECTTCLVNLGMLIVDADPETAAAHYQRAFALDPDPMTLRRIGYARAIQGRDADAEAAYRRATLADPRDANGHYVLANALRRQEKWEQAIIEYQVAVSLDPGNADAHHNFGMALLGAGRLDDAQVRLEEALRLHPRDTDAELALAAVAQARGDTEAEGRWYETALQHASDPEVLAVAHAKFADALARQGRTAEAVTHLQAAARHAPDSVEILSSLAGVLSAEGREGDAIGVLRQALTRTPDDPALASALAWNLATARDDGLRNGPEATRLAEHASARMDNGDPDLLDTLAAAYAESGRFADAVRTAERALALGGGGEGAAATIRERLAGYRVGRPYRQPSPAAASGERQ